MRETVEGGVSVQVRSTAGKLLGSWALDPDRRGGMTSSDVINRVVDEVLPVWRVEGWQLDGIQAPMPGTGTTYTMYLR